MTQPMTRYQAAINQAYNGPRTPPQPRRVLVCPGAPVRVQQFQGVNNILNQHQIDNNVQPVARVLFF